MGVFLLICDAASQGNWFLMFQHIVVVSPSKIEIAKKGGVVSRHRRIRP